MSIGGAVSIANTIFTYFSPTKSPYYAVIAFGTVALAFSMHIGAVEWLTIFIPVLLAVALSTILSFMSRPEFTSDEYNDQLKFARAVGVSAGVLCLVAAGLGSGLTT